MRSLSKATVESSAPSKMVTVPVVTDSLNVAPPDCVIVKADKALVAPIVLPKVITPPVPAFNVKDLEPAGNEAPLTAPLTVILPPVAAIPVVSMVRLSKRVSANVVKLRLAALKLVDEANPEPNWTVPNAAELSIVTAPRGVVPPTGAANRTSPRALEMVMVKSPPPFRVLLKVTSPLAPAVDPVPPEVFIVEAPPRTTGSKNSRFAPSPPTAPRPFPPLAVRFPFIVIILLSVSRLMSPAFPPAPDPIAEPPDVSIDPINIVPFKPVVVMVTEPPACPAPPLVSMDPVTVTAGPTVAGLKELARMTLPLGIRSDGVVVMD